MIFSCQCLCELRIHLLKKSNDGEIIDFIFSKDASVAKYDILLVEDKDKKIPDCIKHLISDSFYYEANE